MADLSDTYREAAEAIKPIVDAAFKRGYTAGVLAAQENFLKALAQIDTTHFPEIARAPETPTSLVEYALTSKSSGGRAIPGTVKPTIIRLLSQHPNGLTTKQIADMTGIKPNSVRGTLWNLQQENEVSKSEGGLYRCLEKQEAQE